MDVDLILSSFNREKAEYILIGGMNFFLVHQPVTTFDVDLWIAETEANLAAVHSALSTLGAEVSFSPKGDDWKLVRDLDFSATDDPAAWKAQQEKNRAARLREVLSEAGLWRWQQEALGKLAALHPQTRQRVPHKPPEVDHPKQD